MPTNKPFRSIGLLLLAQVLALFVRAALEIELVERGMEARLAKHLSYSVVPAILLPLAWPVVREFREPLRALFRPRGITLRLVVLSLLVGLFLRLAQWSAIVARGMFAGDPGLTDGSVIPFSLTASCPSPAVSLSYIAVYVAAIPLIEEIVNRGVFLTALSRYGRAIAIAGSAALFAIFHPDANLLFTAGGGIILGLLAWHLRSLWHPIIAHAAYNALHYVDSYCLRLAWTPDPADQARLPIGMLAVVSLLALFIASAWIAVRVAPAATGRPMPPSGP